MKSATRLALMAVVTCIALLIPVGANAATTTWQVMPFASGSDIADINGVSCTSLSFCMAIGENGPIMLAFEWSGSQWSELNGPSNAAAVSGVACTSPTYCIAVGTAFGATRGTQAAAWYWTAATGWLAMAVYNPSATQWNALNALKCLSASHCEAVGNQSTFNGLVGSRPLAEVWNGSTWSDQAVHGTVPGQLKAVACRSASSCEAVGERPAKGGSARSLALGWNGSQWSNQPMPAAAALTVVDGVSCYQTGCTAVGWQVDSTVAFAWNNSRWASQSPIGSGNVTGASSTSWYAVHCQSASNCTAVGEWLGAPGGPLADTWNGSTWVMNTTPNPGGADLEAMSCTSGGRVCTAVGPSDLAERS